MSFPGQRRICGLMVLLCLGSLQGCLTMSMWSLALENDREVVESLDVDLQSVVLTPAGQLLVSARTRRQANHVLYRLEPAEDSRSDQFFSTIALSRFVRRFGLEISVEDWNSATGIATATLQLASPFPNRDDGRSAGSLVHESSWTAIRVPPDVGRDELDGSEVRMAPSGQMTCRLERVEFKNRVPSIFGASIATPVTAALDVAIGVVGAVLAAPIALTVVIANAAKPRPEREKKADSG